MAKLTITEALAEIKTAAARIGKKRESITRYFARDSRLRDPLEHQGGSKEFVRKERQSIKDLENRIVTIRSAIQQVNLSTTMDVNGAKRTVSEWLNWRREISADQKTFLNQMAAGLTQIRKQAAQQNARIVTADTSSPDGDVVVSVDEQELAREIEELETTLGTLDGKLSLLNATATVDV